MGALGSALSGCGDTSMQNAADTIRQGIFGGDDLSMTRADVNRVPYASIAVRLGNGPQAFVVLGGYDGSDLQWVTADRQLIVTRGGRLTRTVGFDVDLTRTSFVLPDPVASRLIPGREYDCTRLIDISPGALYDIPVRSRFRFLGNEKLVILGSRLATDHWAEEGSADQRGWTFTNDYWIDPRSGYVWKSIQASAPDLPAFEITVLRPALPAGYTAA